MSTRPNYYVAYSHVGMVHHRATGTSRRIANVEDCNNSCHRGHLSLCLDISPSSALSMSLSLHYPEARASSNWMQKHWNALGAPARPTISNLRDHRTAQVQSPARALRYADTSLRQASRSSPSQTMMVGRRNGAKAIFRSHRYVRIANTSPSQHTAARRAERDLG